jgi:hypothetical protein
MAFNKLILEIARRRQYREAAENIVRGMMRQLDSMTLGRRSDLKFHTETYFSVIVYRGKSGKGPLQC